MTSIYNNYELNNAINQCDFPIEIDSDSNSDFDNYIKLLTILFKEHNICPSHGITHAIIVMDLCELAYIECKRKYNLNLFHRKCIMLAGLLHDADDRKFFKRIDKDKYINAENIMRENRCSEQVIKMVIEMINLVSASNNRDNIPEYASGKNIWKLIPRWADRLESIGLVGIKRCFEYTLGKNLPLSTKRTLVPDYISKNNFRKTVLENLATESRYNNYTGGQFNGNSESMIDHYYDKLIRVGEYLTTIEIEVFRHKANERMDMMYNFIRYFGKIKNKKLTFGNEDVIKFIEKNDV
jgi:uncharacterized protein